MIAGIGVDIVQITRIVTLCEKEGKEARFAERLLTEQELQEYRGIKVRDHQAEHAKRFLAKRFAVKEAAAKALGTGFRQGLRYEHFGVDHDELGKPLLVWLGVAHKWFQERALVTSHLSITDEADYVVAMVILEKR